MSIDTVFKPTLPTVFVGAAAVQVCPAGNQGTVYSFRVRNLNTSAAQYFAWGTTAALATAALAATPPTAGLPSPNAIGMLQNSVETFEIPVASYFIATATGFEFTPGQGS
jgi:hypothetical protein